MGSLLDLSVQRLDRPDARIADYFDVIAGTSTGGLIAAMLTTPDKTTGRPRFTAAEIQEHYRKMGPKIFSPRGRLSFVRYDSSFLQQEIKSITGGNTLADSFTSVVIPAFDVRMQKTIMFTSFKPPKDKDKDGLEKEQKEEGLKRKEEKEMKKEEQEEKKPLLSDVCIATAAAPTYFRPHYFKGSNDYNLVDGGVGANNPTMAAIARIAREVLCENDKFEHFGGEMNYEKMVVISIGTGSTMKLKTPSNEGIYRAEDCAKWGAIDWVLNWGFKWDWRRPWIFNLWGPRKPIIDMLMRSSDFLVDYYVAMLLKTNKCEHYLRIQAKVDEKNLSLDDVSNTYMDMLVDEIGEKLLDDEDQVYEVRKITGFYQVDRPKRTNKDKKDPSTKTNKPENPPAEPNKPEEKENPPILTNRTELRRYAEILKHERDRRRGLS